MERSSLKAVILAAGKGSRVASLAGSGPKSLIAIDGIPVIETVISTVRSSGITRFVIVTGYRREALPECLENGARLGVRIEYAFNDRWDDLANGYSVYAARDYVDNEFLVLMSDHVFSSSCLETLLAVPPPSGGCSLLTDPRIETCFDLADATKVLADPDGRVLAMGKDLREYNQLDTGIFYATRGLIAAVERNLARGKSSLTDANLELAAAGKMKARPLSGSEPYWLDIDTPEAVAEFRRRSAETRSDATC